MNPATSTKWQIRKEIRNNPTQKVVSCASKPRMRHIASWCIKEDVTSTNMAHPKGEMEFAGTGRSLHPVHHAVKSQGSVIKNRTFGWPKLRPLEARLNFSDLTITHGEKPGNQSFGGQKDIVARILAKPCGCLFSTVKGVVIILALRGSPPPASPPVSTFQD
jgi:hypothetical protein